MARMLGAIMTRQTTVSARISADPGVGTPPPTIELHLLGGVRLVVDGTDVPVPSSVARLLAFVGLAAPYPVDRMQLAGALWPDHSDDRACANLRSVLWRSRALCDSCLSSSGVAVSLAHEVWLDVQHPDEVIDLHTSRRAGGAIPALLPGWYDDWVVHERERIRQLMLHALEDASRASIDAGDCRAAIDLALHAVAMEPLRETPHRLVAEAHLMEGNHAEAIKAFGGYASLLDRELGIVPSSLFGRVVGAEPAVAATAIALAEG